jgi:hypothetical protein
MTFTHASYTVAWICALPLELAAAKVFLDQVHPRLTQPESDHNVYTLGSVAGHNVVVVCLPTGVYGTTSATAAVSHLMSTYQNVRFGLMVGVGGGFPGEILISALAILWLASPLTPQAGSFSMTMARRSKVDDFIGPDRSTSFLRYYSKSLLRWRATTCLEKPRSAI